MILIENNLVHGKYDLDSAKDMVYEAYEDLNIKIGLAEEFGHDTDGFKNRAKQCERDLRLLSRLKYREDGKLVFKNKEEFISELKNNISLGDNPNEINEIIAIIEKEQYTDDEYNNLNKFKDDYKLVKVNKYSKYIKRH